MRLADTYDPARFFPIRQHILIFIPGKYSPFSVLMIKSAIPVKPSLAEHLAGNKQFLGQLISNLKRKNGKPEPYYVADLINNAERRG